MSAQNLAKSLADAKALSIEMSIEDYHKRPELSNSGLNVFIDETPAHFKYSRENQREPTAAMKRGTIVHAGVLEPERFLDTHVVMPKFTGYTKDGKLTDSAACTEVKEKIAAFLAENSGKVVMDTDLYHQIFGMIGSVLAHPTASKLLQKNQNELSFFAEIDGVKVRCRPDIIREGNLIADLKTAHDASARGFQKAVAERAYHRQAAIYTDILSQVTGEKYDTFTFIAVEDRPPYAVQVFVLDEASIEKGREEYRLGLAKYRECLLTNNWPAYSNEAMPLSLPGWKF